MLPLQIALCFTLLMAAGLLLRTLLNYEHTNLGMRTQGLLVFGSPLKEKRQTTLGLPSIAISWAACVQSPGWSLPRS